MVAKSDGMEVVLDQRGMDTLSKDGKFLGGDCPGWPWNLDKSVITVIITEY